MKKKANSIRRETILRKLIVYQGFPGDFSSSLLDLDSELDSDLDVNLGRRKIVDLMKRYPLDPQRPMWDSTCFLQLVALYGAELLD